MINDEWEVFKKEVKPIKESGIIKDSPKKKTFKKKILNFHLRKNYEEIDLERTGLYKALTWIKIPLRE